MVGFPEPARRPVGRASEREVLPSPRSGLIRRPAAGTTPEKHPQHPNPLLPATTGEFVAADLSLSASRHKIRLPRSPRPTTTPVPARRLSTPVTAAKVAGPTTTPASADSAGPRVSVEPVHGAVMERSSHGTIQCKGASVSLITEAHRAWIAHRRPHGAWGNVRGAAAPKPPQHGDPGTSNFI